MDACFLCIRDDMSKGFPLEGAGRLTAPAQERLLAQSIKRWGPCHLFARCTGEGCVPLRPLEALILMARCTCQEGDRIAYLRESLSKTKEYGVSLPPKVRSLLNASDKELLTSMKQAFPKERIERLQRLGVLQ
jgi:hypothetical protein